MASYTHILFDHDGVLVNTEPLYFQATKQVLGEMEVELRLNEYLDLQAHGGDVWAMARQLGYADEQISAGRSQRNKIYQSLLKSECIDIEGVEEVLTRLAKDHQLAIVTTAKQCDFDLIHAHRNIVGNMALILTNRDYARSKPHPDPYLAALRWFNIEAKNALVVEDSERGLRSAVAAGIDCATVYHSFTAPQNFDAATYHIENLQGLFEIL
ncbi:MAG: HAD family phosphatase [Gammaproteobacteria bacterium]|nr:HAD family phosphatase [Gammaproteobacteria bacterium]